ncbi:diguanylate cyclase (GGDEF) domain-containing protein [Bhargavaea beijingensis]|uniref:Diguanylate cyclase (GGDEF) domain-containing protein n=1 Tax=Bhargavaea beijingensis TaxID=426756 RepID=A0A1G6ZB85_9BACL|nr:GGDEF domain-containing protein [Bhargavaea beijingensis]SDD99949.1 diguanylate cyclase (GGDEF) domain-containing protein [Bhargavaea beijingensis]
MGKPFGILYLDLDQFKMVNDQYGYQAGNRVLREVAVVLRGAASSSSHVFRLSGDEFALIVSATSETSMALLKHRRENDNAKRVRIGSIAVSASMSTARFPVGGRKTTELIDAADRRMYADNAQRK